MSDGSSVSGHRGKVNAAGSAEKAKAGFTRSQRRGLLKVAKGLPVEIKAMGSLLITKLVAGEQRGGGPRGKVKDFSKGSRMRLLCWIAMLAGLPLPIYAHLTYADCVVDPVRAKRDLATLLKRVQRRWRVIVISRMEYQVRGAIHFHLLIWKGNAVPGQAFIPHEWLKAAWNDVCGQKGPSTRVEGVKSRRGAMWYAGKYLAKVPAGDPAAVAEGEGTGDLEGVVAVGLVHDTYLTAWAGRFWGVSGRQWVKIEQAFAEIPWGSWFLDFRDQARRVWRDAGNDGRGFKLFLMGSAGAWVTFAQRLHGAELAASCV